MNETLERIAAAFETYSVSPEGPSPGVCRIRRDREIVEEFPGWSSPEAFARCRELNVRAGIEAIRKPTDAMEAVYDQACDAACLGESLGADRAWAVMIDTILKE